MVAVLSIIVLTAYLAFLFPMERRIKKEEEKSPKYTAQMKKLWQVAQTSMREHKPSRAEKALLTILKFDEKNAAAYNRLGILYAKGQKYDEAVECFEIAQSLDNNPASIHNAGLIYLETGAYEKAVMAFNQAIALEGDVPARFIALAKAEEKIGNNKKAIEALENAFELDPKASTLRQILAIYEGMGDTEAATATAARIEEQIIKDNESKKRASRKAVTKSEKTVSNSDGRKVIRRRVAPRNRPASMTKSKTATRTVSRITSETKSSSRVVKSHVGRKRI